MKRGVLIAPDVLLRLEGAAAVALAFLLYAQQGGNWLLLALLFFVPDLSWAGYLLGPRNGARVYNLVHTYVGPMLLVVAGLLVGSHLAVLLALIWVAHIGLDRLLGFGLKYPTEFKDTHLQHVSLAALAKPSVGVQQPIEQAR